MAWIVPCSCSDCRRLEDVELLQLVHRALVRARQVAQVEVRVRPWLRGWVRSQQYLECVAERRLGAGEVLGQLDQLCGA